MSWWSALGQTIGGIWGGYSSSKNGSSAITSAISGIGGYLATKAGAKQQQK